jgi:hypothetical protein
LLFPGGGTARSQFDELKRCGSNRIRLSAGYTTAAQKVMFFKIVLFEDIHTLSFG